MGELPGMGHDPHPHPVQANSLSYVSPYLQRNSPTDPNIVSFLCVYTPFPILSPVLSSSLGR